tara:strand:+ start:102 stop:761 length:660 start_codon:yes stop_codon:yes gene_type:complete
MRLIALILLLILFPVLLLVSLLVFIDLGFPILYRDRRSGKNFHHFNIIKFRTMTDGDGLPVTMDNDRRVTSIGKFLRNMRLDELPQLVNIINGEINFVGPRPESVSIVDSHRLSFSYLEHIKPGVTDISSIILKNESKILEQHGSKMEYYINEILPVKTSISESYINNLSLWHRFVIVIATLLSLVSHVSGMKLTRTVFYIDDTQFCNKLNNIIGIEIF